MDIAGDFAGSAAALMNMSGNIGGAIAPTVIAYLAVWLRMECAVWSAPVCACWVR